MQLLRSGEIDREIAKLARPPPSVFCVRVPDSVPPPVRLIATDWLATRIAEACP